LKIALIQSNLKIRNQCAWYEVYLSLKLFLFLLKMIFLINEEITYTSLILSVIFILQKQIKNRLMMRSKFFQHSAIQMGLNYSP